MVKLILFCLALWTMKVLRRCPWQAVVQPGAPFTCRVIPMAGEGLLDVVTVLRHLWLPPDKFRNLGTYMVPLRLTCVLLTFVAILVLTTALELCTLVVL